MSRIAVSLSLLFALIPLSESALQAQRTDVPRTRTLPGIESPAFPYAQPEDVGLSSDALQRLGDEVAGWVANGDVVGAELLIIKAGRAVFHEAYGWGDRERNEPVERNAVWSIKSMSKPVTATAVLMLADEGKLSLDDPVSRYIPGFAGDRRTTIRHLLAQTSGDGGGYGGGGYNVYFFDSLHDWVTDWAVQKPTATFGEFRYSNFNYAALGYIVELVAGVPVETFTEQRILQPLGMTDTYTVFTPAAPWAGRVPSRYRWDQEALQYERYWSNRDLQPWAFYPAALGLWGTAMDYARFMSMWLNNGEYEGARLLAERTAETALEPHGFLGAEGLYGYGWFVEAAAGGGMPLTFRHGGADGTVAFAVPEDDAMVIYLSHSGARGQNALQDRVAMLGLFHYPGPWMAWAKESGVVAVRLTPEERTSYTGTYVGEATGEGAPPMLTRVWEEDGRLNMSLGEAGALPIERTHLVPLGDHRFAQGRYRGDRLEGVSTVATTRFAVSGGVVSGVEYLVGGEVEFSARRVDSDSVLASLRAERSRVSVADIVAGALDTGGIDAARARHREIHSSRPDSVRFAESLLDALGHRLLHDGRVPEAVAVFEMNVESWPESPSAHGSLADAFRAAGNHEDASTAYERAIELAEQTDPMQLRTFRARLEEVKRRITGAEEANAPRPRAMKSGLPSCAGVSRTP